MKSRSRKTGSELAQVVIVHSAMLTALVAIVLLINAFHSSARANISRGVASFATQSQALQGAEVIGAIEQVVDWELDEQDEVQ